MASKIRDIKQLKLPETYELVESKMIKEIDSFAVALRHKKSGARVLVVSNDDNNKVFNIGFRTPPKDCTGVPHIIEHTVLCGSKEFPAKDPFVELVKGSLNTYLNATTYPDKTMYPVASTNDKDFKNLMYVYLDAVFYPNIYKYKEIFKQEGWHYELDSKDGEIIYNGVVYNEMKGAYSSEESVLERFVLNSIFPDNTYGQESGGDPKCIPDLTYEDYLEFHRSHYHPSNSYIYLYGDMDVEERLNFLDEKYLKDFDAIEVDTEIPLQKPFGEMKRLETEYAVSDDSDCKEKTYYAFATAMDVTLDTKVCKALDLLSYVLVSMPGAPLKQALLDKKIGSDVDVDFCDILRQSMFTISTKNAKAGIREEFYNTIKEVLEKIVKEGIDKKALEAALNGIEFKEREADYGMYPKGLLYGIKTFKTWLYNDDMAYTALCYDEDYQFLRNQLKTNYFEQLIEKYLLNNSHAVLVEMKPVKGLSAKEEQKTKEKLEAYKKSLSDEQIEALIEDTKALKKYQETPSPKEVLEKIPMLAREDIAKETEPYHNTEKQIHGVKTIWHELSTNDIVYLTMYFDIKKYDNYVPQISFLTTLLGYMDTEKHTYNEFDTEVNFYTGGIGSGLNIISDYLTDDYKMYFSVDTRVLTSKVDKAIELMGEMVFETLFEDDKHLQEVVAESRSRTKVRLMASGHKTAADIVKSAVSKREKLLDNYNGMGYYEYLVKLDENFDEEKDKLKSDMKKLIGAMLSKENLLISITGKDEEFNAVNDAIEPFLAKLDKWSLENEISTADLTEYRPEIKKTRVAYTTPADVLYVAVGGEYKEVESNFGALCVAKHLLNYDYLWNEVRVKGGAYGVMCSFDRTDVGIFTSYRDPNLKGTIDVYEKADEYLAQYDVNEREMTKTVIGTISGIDTPLTPNMKGKRSMGAYLSHFSIEEQQKTRKQVLECSIKDIQSLAPVVRTVCDAKNLCVIGNEKKIRENADLFDEIKSLS